MVSNTLRTDHVDYALRLNQALAEPDQVWSPYSVASALGLIAAGARGRTREELLALLGSDLDAHLAALDDAVAAGPQLATCTSLWLRDGLSVNEDFEERLRTRPASAVHTADFAGDAEGVRQAVNETVSKVTNGLIEDLLAPGTVTPQTQALLLNALWVRVLWNSPFETAQTKRKEFRTPAGKVRVATMHQQERMRYAEAEGWRMVTLAGDHDLALDVLLPPPESGAVLDAATVKALNNAASTEEVALALPRFELSKKRELTAALREAGVGEVFTAGADLSGISDSAGPLRVDALIHESRLRVDEKGAEGAAATAGMVLTSAAVVPRVIEFKVDRSFAFVLRRREAVLFLGSVANPYDPGPAS